MAARAIGLGVMLISTLAVAATDAMEPDDLPAPQLELARDAAALELPAIPAFDLPAADPGEHRPRELRVHGRRMLESVVKVSGYVTGIYDCVAELRRLDPAASRAQIRQSVDADPTLCSQPRFYLGDARDTPPEASIWVVDVPALPRLAVGDRIAVTGTWSTRSQHGEHDTEGLLLFGALERATAEPAIPQIAAAPASPEVEAEISVVTTPPLRKVVDEQARNVSVTMLNACNKAIANHRYDDAITECRAATGIWDGNHLAWYALASACLARSDWRGAQAAIARAVALRPDRAMYQLYDGIARYEAVTQAARDDLARAQHKQPRDVTLDPSRLSLDAARDALRRAARIEPGLWRAHYYLGRLYRDLDDARRAAEQFTQAIRAHAGYRPGYIALSELYRRWGYLDQALAVASCGAQRVRPTEAADLWFEAGLIYDARHLEDEAIAAFGKMLETRPLDVTSKFQRGQIYFRKGDFADARLDLEDVVRSNDPELVASRPIAQQLLNQMAMQAQRASQPRSTARFRATVRQLRIVRPVSP